MPMVWAALAFWLGAPQLAITCTVALAAVVAVGTCALICPGETYNSGARCWSILMQVHARLVGNWPSAISDPVRPRAAPGGANFWPNRVIRPSGEICITGGELRPAPMIPPAATAGAQAAAALALLWRLGRAHVFHCERDLKRARVRRRGVGALRGRQRRQFEYGAAKIVVVDGAAGLYELDAGII